MYQPTLGAIRTRGYSQVPSKARLLQELFWYRPRRGKGSPGNSPGPCEVLIAERLGLATSPDHGRLLDGLLVGFNDVLLVRLWHLEVATKQPERQVSG